jgi:hypothetical protein
MERNQSGTLSIWYLTELTTLKATNFKQLVAEPLVSFASSETLDTTALWDGFWSSAWHMFSSAKKPASEQVIS